jgi:hypothetical protein
MENTTFEARLTQAGLSPANEDLPALRALVVDLDRAATAIRAPRPYWEEPLSAFRLTRNPPRV